LIPALSGFFKFLQIGVFMQTSKSVSFCVSGKSYDATRVKQLRARLNLSQSDFSRQFGIPLPTLKAWEQSLNPPSQLANSLLEVIDTVSMPEKIEEFA
jgi:DNA-binding transcriptional regulator YiaG